MAWHAIASQQIDSPARSSNPPRMFGGRGSKCQAFGIHGVARFGVLGRGESLDNYI